MPDIEEKLTNLNFHKQSDVQVPFGPLFISEVRDGYEVNMLIKFFVQGV